MNQPTSYWFGLFDMLNLNSCMSGNQLFDMTEQLMHFIQLIVGENPLTESDVQILKIALTEHIVTLKEKGLNLSQDDSPAPPAPITKKMVVKFLYQIGQHELANILNEDNGKSGE